ncbi:MAG: hypothetical protein IAE85_13875, partial [Anaerolinea sp.]|nr:hypothetical protein [Anaerolinea sp.]
HFAVHGDGDGLLLNHPSDERSESLPGDDLLRIVRTHQDAATQRLHLIVMPDCYTAHLAEGLGDVVNAAVGMTDEVEDAPVQQVITPVFYRRLADGTTVANALAAVDAELRRQGLETAAEMVRVYPKTGGQVKPLDWNTAAPEPLTLSPHHRQYLAQLCGAMKRVNLANILETQRREPELLDIYVPLPVDAELVLVVRDRRAADWWIDTSDGHERDPQVNEARLAGLGRAGEEMGGRERPKTWPALRLDAGDLAPLVQYVRGQMAQQIAEERDARFGRRGENALRWRIDVEQAASLQPRMVLIGDPGSGKSSFLRHLALCLAGECLRRAGDTTTPGRAGAAQLAGWLAPTDLTPIYIELRALVADFPPLPEPDTLPRPEDLPTLAGHFWPYVQATVLDARLAAFEPELATLCLDGRAILLLDGLDEVNQAESPERRQQIHHLIQQLTDTYPKLRIVVGSRPYAYEVGDWALDGFGVARLIPLPNDRLRRLAVQLFGVLASTGKAEEQAERFLDALTRADLDPDIVANPLYFTLWLALWQSTPAPHRLPATTRAGLYGAAVDLLLTRWFRRKQSEVEQALGVPAERLRPVLETLACNLLADERRQDGNRFEFHISELDAVLRDARAGHRREYSRLDLDVVDGFLAQHAGLLTLVSPRPNHYRFLHASFQEYLAACELTCPAPAQRVPPVAPARYFPAGLLHYARSQPDGWWNATHLAADQLLATGRSAELWSLLAELCAPYVAGEGNARAALLAMAVINKLPAGTLPGTLVSTVVTAAARLLADVKHVPLPAQRLTAGDALARLGDPRPGVTVRSGLPDIAWVEIPEFDGQGRRQFT